MLKLIATFFILLTLCSNSFSQNNSEAREWNELILEAIRNDFARPTVHARNLFHHSIICYDAWAAYDASKKTYFLGDTINGFVCAFDGVGYPSNIEEARNKTIAYASYRFIKNRYSDSPDYQETFYLINDLMSQKGYDTSISSTQYNSGGAAELGNYLAEQIQLFGYTDGSNEQNDFGNMFYAQVNAPLVMAQPGNPDIIDPNRWQPISLTQSIDQSGNIVSSTPDHLTPEWGAVLPFSLDTTMYTDLVRDGHTYHVYADTNMPAFLNLMDSSSWNSFYKWNHSLVSIWQSHLDPSDGVMWDISPASIGNNSWYPSDSSDYASFYNLIDGGDPGMGHALNPVTGLPYAPQLVPRGDYARVLAEFWADGIDSETPPGHWFEIYHYVTDQPSFQRNWEGVGPILSKLEYDVKAYLALSGAMHDAAICAWSLKGYYDYIRPVSSIRYMTDMGQSSDTTLLNYSPHGIPLLPGYIEVVEIGDALAGTWNEHVGKIKVYTWKGHDYIVNTSTDVAGVGWILAENWWPYQRPTFVTPPFAGYVSGHSTFSRAGAQILEFITGSEFFPGGLGTFHAEQNEYLKFENGPSVSIDLQWATYRDASDQCSLSRIWGGIHPPIDDIPGRMIGEQVGIYAFDLADSIFNLEYPALIHASVSDSIISISDIGNTFVVSLTFNEEMDTSVVFSNQALPLALSSSISLGQINWIDEYNVDITYDIMVNSAEILHTSLVFNGLFTESGSLLPSIALTDFFIIDTKRPQIESIQINYDVVNDFVTSQHIILNLEFDEPCDTMATPTIEFESIGLVNPTINEDISLSHWMNDSIFIGYYTSVDFNEIVEQIDTKVYNVNDAYQNSLDTLHQSGLFVIDTKNPQMLNVVTTDSVITQADLSSPQFNVMITFDKVMNTAISPVVSLNSFGVPFGSIIQNYAQTDWIDSLNLSVQFLVYPSLNNSLYLDFICSNLEDFNGNPLIDSIVHSLIMCDMKSPEVLFVELSNPIISDSLIGLDEYFIDVHFDEKMDTIIKPLVMHTANQNITNSIQYSFNSSFFIDTVTYRAFFNVLDDNIEVDSIDVEVDYGYDFQGNNLNSFSDVNRTSIDTKNPKVIGLYANTYSLNEVFDSLKIVTLFDEEMLESQLCDIVFDPTLSSPVVLSLQERMWLNSNSHSSTFLLQNGPIQWTSYGINLNSGVDLAGNISIPMVQEDFVSIDPVLNLSEISLDEVIIYPSILSNGNSLNIVGLTANNHNQEKIECTLVNTQGKVLNDLVFLKEGNKYKSDPIFYTAGMYYLKVDNKLFKLIIR